jgi:biopolymer transport protein ExbB
MRWIAAILMAAVLAGSIGDWVTAQFTDNPAPCVVFAQEEGEVPTGGRTWWDNIKAGGPIGFLIILMSVAMLALIIQYTVEQKHDKLVPPHVVAELEQLFEEQAFDEAAEMCQAEDTYLTRIVGGGLSRMEGGFDAIMKGVEIAGDEETTKLLQKLANLALIAGIAPMLGLFGTVAGMISAFNVIASTAGGASPAQLADGISMALVTTFLGLLVAIPALAGLHFLKARAIKVSMETSTIVSDMFERLRAPQG